MKDDSAMQGSYYKKGIARTSQSLSERIALLPGADAARVGIAKILDVYTETMTCDIETPNGSISSNVPVLTRCGLENDEVWGEVELPSIGSHVIIIFIEGRESFPVILGTLFPYGNNKYQSGQTPVASADKAFSLKLLEKLDQKLYRRIFKSGASVEVKEDGTILIETPSGTSVQIDETAKKITVEQKDGSDVCTLTLAAASGFDIKDKNNNEVVSSSSGMQLKDKNNNVIDMVSGKVTINSNLEVSQ
jgi:hypothetical protein